MRIKRRNALIILNSLVLSMMGYLSIEFLIAGICIFLLLVLHEKNTGIISILICIFILMIGFINYLSISFDFMPQARTLLEINTNVSFWFRQGHLHAIRLLLAYPGYFFSKIYNISLDSGYTYYMIIIFFSTSIMLYNICSYIKKQNIISLIGILFFILVLFCIMNGRIIFAFLGFSLLLYSALRLNDYNSRITVREIPIVILGVGFSCVSSGCMVVSVAFLIIYLYLKWKFHYSHSEKKKAIAVCGIALLLCWNIFGKIISYIVAMINKNIVYYGGGFRGMLGMLQHGMGRVIPLNYSDYFPQLLLICLSGFLCVMLLKRIFIKRYEFKAIIAVAICLCCFGGLFGYSTGSMVLIPSMILISLYINRFKLSGRKYYAKL